MGETTAAKPLGGAVALPFHPEILADAQASVLRATGGWSTRKRFYLVGGTAVALHLGHRMSVDFDWFGPDRLSAPRRFITELRAYVGDPLEEQLVERGTVYATLHGVKLSWFHYRYRLLQPLETWRDIAIASLDDLAAMKLAAIHDRSTRKDFIDLYALLETGKDLGSLLELFLQKYPRASREHVVRSLVYFDDAERERMPRMRARWTWAAVKRRIRAAVADLAR